MPNVAYGSCGKSATSTRFLAADGSSNGIAVRAPGTISSSRPVTGSPLLVAVTRTGAQRRARTFPSSPTSSCSPTCPHAPGAAPSSARPNPAAARRRKPGLWRHEVRPRGLRLPAGGGRLCVLAAPVSTAAALLLVLLLERLSSASRSKGRSASRSNIVIDRADQSREPLGRIRAGISRDRDGFDRL